MPDRRSGMRRAGERRKGADANYNLAERRLADADRRITIVNRLKNEVTDRRSLR